MVNMESADHLARFAERGQRALNVTLLTVTSFLHQSFLNVSKGAFAIIYGLSGLVVLNNYAGI